jgi:hypothetical protein
MMSRPHAAMWMLEVAGATVDVVLGAARDIVADAPHRIQVLEPGGEREMLYVSAELGLDYAFRALETGALRSIRIDFEGGAMDWLLLFAPHFNEDASPWWSLVAQQQASEEPLRAFRTASRRPGLRFAALTADESLDDLPARVDAGSFPWNHPDLVVAAVYDDAGAVTARLGPYLIPSRI